MTSMQFCEKHSYWHPHLFECAHCATEREGTDIAALRVARDNWAALCAATGEDLRQCKADLAAARAERDNWCALAAASNEDFRLTVQRAERAEADLAIAKADRNTYDSAHKNEAAAHLRTMADLAVALALLLSARDQLEYWTPDESLSMENEQAQLNAYYALRDRIDTLAGEERKDAP